MVAHDSPDGQAVSDEARDEDDHVDDWEIVELKPRSWLTNISPGSWKTRLRGLRATSGLLKLRRQLSSKICDLRETINLHY